MTTKSTGVLLTESPHPIKEKLQLQPMGHLGILNPYINIKFIIHRRFQTPDPHTKIYKTVVRTIITSPQPPQSVEVDLGWYLDDIVYLPTPWWHELFISWIISHERGISGQAGLCRVVYWNLSSISLNWQSVPHNQPATIQDNHDLCSTTCKLKGKVINFPLCIIFASLLKVEKI